MGGLEEQGGSLAPGGLAGAHMRIASSGGQGLPVSWPMAIQSAGPRLPREAAEAVLCYQG